MRHTVMQALPEGPAGWQTQLTVENSGCANRLSGLFQFQIKTNSAVEIEQFNDRVVMTIGPRGGAVAGQAIEPVSPTAALFLRSIYDLCTARRIDEAIDSTIGYFDDYLSGGYLNVCDAALRQAELPRLDPAVALSFLSMTLVEKGRLLSRADFVYRLRLHLAANRGSADAAALLRGLA